jgi:dienelactone hydrolase
MRSLVPLLLLIPGCVVLPPPPPLPVPPVRVQPAPVEAYPAPRVEAAPIVPIEVMRPSGAGPFPAVVVLHDCSGLGPRSSGSPKRWASILVQQGYVVAIPDSFSTRGHGSGVCVNDSPSRNEVAPVRRVPDAYDALDHLRALPYVDGARVGVMGGSHGGATTLQVATVLPRDSQALAERKRHGFKAAIALYPGCAPLAPPARATYVPVAPLLILHGELDDWTPAAPCERLAQAALQSGHPVSIKVYPGAHHSFDSANPVRYNGARVNANSPTGRGATTGGNAQAWTDSIEQVKGFFAHHLKG